MDFVTIALMLVGVGLLCSVLALGRTVWWTDAAWIGWALIGSILLIAGAIAIENRRANPLLNIRFLSQWAILRIAAIAICIRIVTAEQTFASVGLLSTLGYGIEQLQPLYVIVTLASVAGIIAAIVTFRPQFPGRAMQVACLIIAIAAVHGFQGIEPHPSGQCLPEPGNGRLRGVALHRPGHGDRHHARAASGHAELHHLAGHIPRHAEPWRTCRIGAVRNPSDGPREISLEHSGPAGGARQSDRRRAPGGQRATGQRRDHRS